MAAATHTAAQLERARRLIHALRQGSGYTRAERRARRAKAAELEREHGLGRRGPNSPNAATAPDPLCLGAPPPAAPAPVVWHPAQRPFVRVYGTVPAPPTLRQRLAALWRALPACWRALRAGLAAAPARAPHYPQPPGPVQRAAQGVFNAAVGLELARQRGDAA